MKEELKIILKILNDFNNFINNRSFFLSVLSKEFFPKILDLHFKTWEKEYKYWIKKGYREEFVSYGEIFRILDSTLGRIEKISLNKRETLIFFNYFKKHVETYKKKVIEHEDEKYYYIEVLFNTFYQIFFENIGSSPERYSIWKNYFPKEWKITKNNLENKENIISLVSLNNFIKWTRDRIWRAKEEIDEDLDNVSSNLFPEVSPILWAPILIFVLSPYGENRVKSVIERTWNFGFVGRIEIFSVKEEEFRKKIRETAIKEEENTIELAYLLFKKQFSKENINKYIKALKYLEYPKEPTKENKRINLLNIFTKIKKYIEKRLEKI